jgi:hypothetical protein
MVQQAVFFTQESVYLKFLESYSNQLKNIQIIKKKLMKKHSCGGMKKNKDFALVNLGEML